jgi:hypothetical protein
MRWLDQVDDPEDLSTHENRILCLMALGRNSQAEKLLQSWEQRPFPTCMQALSDELAVMGLMRARGTAEAAINRILARLAPQRDANRKRLETELRAQMEYCMGNLPAFAQLAKESGSPEGGSLVQALLSEGKLKEAAGALGKESEQTQTLLVFYLAASGVQDAAAADYLSRAVAKLRKGDPAHQRFGEALANGGVPWSELLPQSIAIEEKRVLTVAVGLRRPELRDEAFALARKLNVDPRFPHMLIDACVSGK